MSHLLMPGDTYSISQMIYDLISQIFKKKNVILYEKNND